VGKGGLVKDTALWNEVLARIVDHASARGMSPQRIVRSPLPGATGNVEFFLWLRPGQPEGGAALESDRSEAVHGAARIPR